MIQEFWRAMSYELGQFKVLSCLFPFLLQRKTKAYVEKPKSGLLCVWSLINQKCIRQKALLIWIFQLDSAVFISDAQSQTSALIFLFDVEHINSGQNKIWVFCSSFLTKCCFTIKTWPQTYHITTINAKYVFSFALIFLQGGDFLRSGPNKTIMENLNTILISHLAFDCRLLMAPYDISINGPA